MPRMAENAKPSAKLLKRLKTKYVFVRFEHESLYLFCIGFWVLCHFWHMGEVKNWPLRKTQRKTTQEVEENDIHKSAFSNQETSSNFGGSFSAVSKALMPSNGAFFTEWYKLQWETNEKHGIDEKNTVSANRKPARRARHTLPHIQYI